MLGAFLGLGFCILVGVKMYVRHVREPLNQQLHSCTWLLVIKKNPILLLHSASSPEKVQHLHCPADWDPVAPSLAEVRSQARAIFCFLRRLALSQRWLLQSHPTFPAPFAWWLRTIEGFGKGMPSS